MGAGLIVVALALMANCQNGDCFVVFDLEQGNVASRAKRNDQLAQEGIAGLPETGNRGQTTFSGRCLLEPWMAR